MPNLWRIMVNCIRIWLAATDEGMLKVDELVYLYRLKEFKEHRYYKLVPGDKGPGSSGGYLCHSNIGSSGFSLCQGTTLRLPLARFGVISLGCIVGGEP